MYHRLFDVKSYKVTMLTNIFYTLVIIYSNSMSSVKCLSNNNNYNNVML